MMTPTATRRVIATLFVLTAAACGGEDVSNLHPEFGFDDSVATDPTGGADRVVDFGDVTLGTSAQRTLILKNLGRSPLTLEAFTVELPFEIERPVLTIDAEGSLALPVHFIPTALGAYTQTLTLASDGGGGTVRLVGNAVKKSGACTATVRPGSVVFGNTAPGTQVLRSVAIDNSGEEACTITSVSLKASSAAAFEITNAPADGTALGVGAREDVELRFAPIAAARDLVGVLVVKLAPGNVETEIPLSGDGVESCSDPLPDGTCPAATSPVYGNTASALFRYDPAEGVTHKVGTFKAQGVNNFSMVDVAIDGAGVMFGVSAGKLWVVNPETAGCSLVADLPEAIETPGGLTVLPDGRLVVADDSLVVINRNTAQVIETLVGKDEGYDTAGDVIALPDGKLYWSVNSTTSSDHDRLVRVDPSNGQIIDLGSLGLKGVWGLAWADDVLYGFTDKGRLLEINPADGDVESNTSLSGAWWGATSNPARW